MNSPVHVYLDLDVINNDSTTNSDPPILRFEEIRNSPFIDNTEEYFCSIIRFSLQSGSSLPLLIPRVQIGQADVNKTVYLITLVYTYTPTQGGVTTSSFQAPVSYVPKNSQPTPQQPLATQDLSTSYYFVQAYQDFADMINKQLSVLWENMVASVQSADIKTGHHPFVQFDPDSGKFVVYGDAAVFDENITIGSKVSLWLNTRLFELISGFPSYNAGPTGDQNYRIVFTNNYDTNVQQIQYTTLPPSISTISYDAIQVFQEISTIAMWNPVASIVFSSSMLPVLSTNISPPQVYNDPSNSLRSTGNNAGLFNILTDFEVPYSAGNQYRPTIDYNPGTEYRLLDMNAIMNLNRVDVSVYWKTHYGEYIPFRLQRGAPQNNV